MIQLDGLFRRTDNARDFAARSVIFEEGATGDYMYVVLDGEVELRSGDEVLAILKQGDILGEMALIDNKPRSATATAKTACRVAQVDEQRFLYMTRETPFFALHVMRVLVERLRRTTAACASR